MEEDRSQTPPRIERLRVENYRALKQVELKEITPLTVLLGPNGSGKSTLFDAFSFLSECFQQGLRAAWDRRGRAKELRTRGATGPIVFELKYRERPKQPLITYHLAIDEGTRGPIVAEEWLQWRRGSHGKPFRFLEYQNGQGQAASGEMPDEQDRRIDIPLRSPDLMAVNTLGQFADHPRVAALREFITDWHVSYLSIDDTRSQPEAGPQENLSRTGDNLANVIQYLNEQHPQRLEEIFGQLRARVPRLERVEAEAMPDGRLLLLIKDTPFDQPVLSRFASVRRNLEDVGLSHASQRPPAAALYRDRGAGKLPASTPVVRSHEECRAASERAQLLITTHSPDFLNGLRPDEVRILYRDLEGYTHATRCSEIQGVSEFMDAGASLGHLWQEGYFGMGDPLVNEGAPEDEGITRDCDNH